MKEMRRPDRRSIQPDDRRSDDAGMNMVGSNFHTSESPGNHIGDRRYNEVLGTYREIRLGGGVSHRLNQRLSAEAEAGCSVNRQIDCTRMAGKVEFAPAPYVQLGLRMNF